MDARHWQESLRYQTEAIILKLARSPKCRLGRASPSATVSTGISSLDCLRKGGEIPPNRKERD
jgi:hypothetical protein